MAAPLAAGPSHRQLIHRLRTSGRVPRTYVLAVIDAVLWMVAVPLATILRYEFNLSAIDAGGLLAATLVAAGANTALGHLTGSYRGKWRIGSIDEAVGVATLALLTTLTLIAATLGFGRLIPLGAAFSAGIIGLGLMSTSRVVWRLVTESVDPSVEAKRMLVFGAGESAAQVITAILADQDRAFRPVALLDDDPAKARRSIRGVRVVGTRNDLVDAAQLHRADVLLIAAPSADSSTIRELTALGTKAGLEVLVLPPPSELYGTLGLGDIRQVSHEDLLGRNPVKTDLEQVAGYIAGRTILVTGAGGSIGSELCRQVSALKPANLVMLDRDESALHAVQLSLTGRAMLDSDELVVADIRDRSRMHDIFAQWKPDVVFHAAALKHLTLLEQHPSEGVKTNVLGSLHVLEAAVASGVDRFVNVSTDKSADPTSVLGYTKRIAERLTAHFGATAEGTFQSVRFGNVLGSRGSVLTAFRSQIENGGPITVTHPDVSRYFMTVQEAVQLVIQAGAVGTDGDALVLDMGEPVKIKDVADRMIEAAERDIEIEYTGLRPGEKLHEILLGIGEADVRPAHPLISHASVPPLDPIELSMLDEHMDDFDVMISLCANHARRWTADMWETEVAPGALGSTTPAKRPAVAPVNDDIVIDVTDAAVAAPPAVRIRLAKPDLGEAELDGIRDVFASGILTNGPKTAEFERIFAARHQVRHAVAVANGTIGLQAILTALDIGPGDEVIVPSLTFISSATSVRHVGATPVWAEVDPTTFNIDPLHVARLLTPRTKAVMAVHYAGQAADMDALRLICEDRGIHLLEDAAEAHGANYKGRPVGGLGTAAMFSFTPTKNITTGEGGMITTDDDVLAARLRVLRNHGMSALYVHDSLGYNWRMTEMQAAIGIVQVGKLDGILKHKQANAAWMTDRLAGIPGVTPPVVRPDRDHVYMLYTLQVEEGRDEFLAAFAAAGIEARVYFPPAHLQQAFEGKKASLPMTERLAGRIFSIPMHAGLTQDELEEIATVVEETAARLELTGVASSYHVA